MKGRGARVVTRTELNAVTPDAVVKTHFIIVDAVGACETELVDTHPLERKPSVSFGTLLNAVAYGNREKDVLCSLASRLARLDRQLSGEDRAVLENVAGGKPLSVIARGLVDALDPETQLEAACSGTGTLACATAEIPPEAIEKAAAALLDEAAKPLATNPALRNKLIELKKSYEQTIDTVTKDEVLEAGFSAAAKEKARTIVESFEKFIQEHKDEITALQILYSRPYSQRLTLKGIKELAAAIEKPPRGWTPQVLWRAYETLEKSRVQGAGGRVLADIVSLVRFALHQENELRPFHDEVNERFDQWMAQQEKKGRRFTDEQRQWLEAIRDHIAASLAIEMDDFDYVPFLQRGGLGKAQQVFGEDLPEMLMELNEVLVT
jgi:type I restriction enzyme R subunit